uniref:Uncharacterized protein n=1 Tax=Candidatus Kentrum sp. TUN TaxID=2126343 RepID=A0A451A9C7_9GAMM|nr:MAG: hypothetical protein BECKTUN1418F_GA0071002_10862 [Candidatus Kentron sp. TUN]VFK62628.1 MAG: hypothetical protein BECKTUN1418E_GA0071001_10842 [Candidatus Kentron sp. TUN]
MSALCAETERGLALLHLGVLSGFLFFRYVKKVTRRNEDNHSLTNGHSFGGSC